jgi:hypothetical protein
MSGNIDILCRLPDVAAIGRVKLQEYCNEWHKRPVAREYGVSHLIVGDNLLLTIRNTSPGGEIAPIDLPEYYKWDAGGLARRQIVKAGVRLGVLLGGKSGVSSGRSSTNIHRRECKDIWCWCALTRQ